MGRVARVQASHGAVDEDAVCSARRGIPQQTVPGGENTPRQNFQTQRKPCVRLFTFANQSQRCFNVCNQHFV